MFSSTDIIDEENEARGDGDKPYVAERYVLHDKMGEGGFARVFRAYDGQMQRDVAIKILLPELLGTGPRREQFLQRFDSEVALCASLDHPHLVPVYDRGVIDEGGPQERPFLVMKLLEGTDLEHSLRDMGKLPVKLVQIIGLQVLDALAYIHAQGVVHKDLKPANLFLTHDRLGQPHLYVMDFGISHDSRSETGRLTRTGAFAGTVQYLAPEYVLENRQEPSPCLDVFQMGLILAELITGAPLIAHGTTLPALIARYIKREEIVLPDVLVGSKVGSILERALSFEPEDRYQDAHEMLLDWSSLEDHDWPSSFEGDHLAYGHTIEAPAPPMTHEALPDASMVDAVATPLSSTFENAPLVARIPAATTDAEEVVAPMASAMKSTSTKLVLFIALAMGACLLVIALFDRTSTTEDVSMAPAEQATTTSSTAPPTPVASPVEVLIESEPIDGVEVFSSRGELLGSTPLTLTLDPRDGERSYSLRHVDYQDAVLRLSGEEAASSHVVSLVPLAQPEGVEAVEAVEAPGAKEAPGQGDHTDEAARVPARRSAAVKPVVRRVERSSQVEQGEDEEEPVAPLDASDAPPSEEQEPAAPKKPEIIHKTTLPPID